MLLWRVPKVNFKGFNVDNAQANWNARRITYRDNDPSLMITCERTCLFHLSASVDKVTQTYIKPSLQFQSKQICKDYKDAKTMDDTETKYNVICGGCHSELPQNEAFLDFQSGWGYGTFVIGNGVGHMLFVSAS